MSVRCDLSTWACLIVQSAAIGSSNGRKDEISQEYFTINRVRLSLHLTFTRLEWNVMFRVNRTCLAFHLFVRIRIQFCPFCFSLLQEFKGE